MQVQLFSLQIHHTVLRSKDLKIRPIYPAFTLEKSGNLREEIVYKLIEGGLGCLLKHVGVKNSLENVFTKTDILRRRLIPPCNVQR